MAGLAGFAHYKGKQNDLYRTAQNEALRQAYFSGEGDSMFLSQAEYDAVYDAAGEENTRNHTSDLSTKQLEAAAHKIKIDRYRKERKETQE